jgi:hypothetical protein
MVSLYSLVNGLMLDRLLVLKVVLVMCDSADGTIASIDFFAPRPSGSRDMTPYSGFDRLRRHVVNQLQNPRPQATSSGGATPPGAQGYMKRLAYLETRIRDIPNSQGSEGRGYFQAFNAFDQEATAAAGGISPRDSNYDNAAFASWKWIEKFNKPAAKAILAGRYDEADRLLKKYLAFTSEWKSATSIFSLQRS